MIHSLEQRHHRRLRSPGLTADIEDGRFISDGYIDDFSFDGLRVTQLPKRFIINKDHFFILVSGHNKLFKLEISPCWVQRKFPGNYQIVGFKIINPTRSWIEFVRDNTCEREH